MAGMHILTEIESIHPWMTFDMLVKNDPWKNTSSVFDDIQPALRLDYWYIEKKWCFSLFFAAGPPPNGQRTEYSKAVPCDRGGLVRPDGWNSMSLSPGWSEISVQPYYCAMVETRSVASASSPSSSSDGRTLTAQRSGQPTPIEAFVSYASLLPKASSSLQVQTQARAPKKKLTMTCSSSSHP